MSCFLPTVCVYGLEREVWSNVSALAMFMPAPSQLNNITTPDIIKTLGVSHSSIHYYYIIEMNGDESIIVLDTLIVITGSEIMLH